MSSVSSEGTRSNSLTSTPDLNFEDLELMHHFSTVVCFTLSKDPRIQRMWQISVPKEAFSKPYLMHGLLAISALHLAHTSLNGTEEYRAIASRHEDIALASFRPLLQEVTSENCAAMCASASLTVVFCAGFLAERIPKPGPLEGILEIGHLARGVGIVAESAAAWLSQSSMEPLMQYPDIRNSPPLSHDTQEALAQLKSCVMEVEDPDNATSYLVAIETLDGNFRAMLVKPDHPVICLAWLVLVDRHFVDLLKQEAPLALLIVAHWGVMLNVASETWFVRSWGRQIIEYVYEHLPKDWKPRVAWPAKKVAYNAPMV